jgi:hypothetical protein
MYYAHMAAACEQEAAEKDAAWQRLWQSLPDDLELSEGCAVGIKDCLDELMHLHTLKQLLQRCAAAYTSELQTAQQQFASLP